MNLKVTFTFGLVPYRQEVLTNRSTVHTRVQVLGKGLSSFTDAFQSTLH